MFRCLALALLLSALLFVACGGGSDGDESDGTTTPSATRTAAPNDGNGGDSGDLQEHEDELRETVPAAYKAIFAGGAVDAYAYFSEDFKRSCSLSDFTGLIALIKTFLGDLEDEDVEVDVKSVLYKDDRALVVVTGDIKGDAFDPGDGLSEFWVYEDGEWRLGTDEQDPCDASTTFGGEATPATGPGSSRDETAPLGDSVEVGSLRYTVLEVDLDAADQLESLSDFPATPEAGRKVVLVRVRVEHTGDEGDDSIEVYESDIEITGSNNLLYDSFDEETSCGYLDDTLQGEMFPGGEVEGFVCFQVPDDENGLLLVAEPSFSFGDEGRRFFALE